MSEILPKHECSFPDFTQKCVIDVNFEIASKQLKLNTNTIFATFTSLHNVYKITTKKYKTQSYNETDWCFVEVILAGNLTKEPYAAKASSTYSGYEKSRPAGSKAGPPSYIALTCFLIMQVLKITDISPKHNFSFQNFTQKCANYNNLTIATKQQK